MFLERRPDHETHNLTRQGTIGWLLVGATVVGAEVYFEESLTHAFQRGLDNPRYRPLVLGGLAVTVLHLTRLLPRPADPFYLIEASAHKVQDAYRTST
jgi:hypothetical protein